MVLQILEMNPEDEAEEDGANIDLDSQRKGKCVVLKTSTRQVTYYNTSSSSSSYPSIFLFVATISHAFVSPPPPPTDYFLACGWASGPRQAKAW